LDFGKAERKEGSFIVCLTTGEQHITTMGILCSRAKPDTAKDIFIDMIVQLCG